MAGYRPTETQVKKGDLEGLISRLKELVALHERTHDPEMSDYYADIAIREYIDDEEVTRLVKSMDNWY